MQRYRTKYGVVVIACILGLLPACIKYHDIVKSEFPQGEKQPDVSAVADVHKRSATVYDQFSTKAIFDSMWLSDSLRRSYVDMYAHKRGIDGEAREAELKRQLAENRVWLSFYLLADVRDRSFTQMNEKDSFWTTYAVIDGKHKIVPESIKEVELEPEFQQMFGSRYVHFKTPYLIKMRVSEQMAEHIASGKYTSIALVVGSVYKKCEMVWKKEVMHPKKKVMNDEDFYWG